MSCPIDVIKGFLSSFIPGCVLHVLDIGYLRVCYLVAQEIVDAKHAVMVEVLAIVFRYFVYRIILLDVEPVTVATDLSCIVEDLLIVRLVILRLPYGNEFL